MFRTEERHIPSIRNAWSALRHARHELTGRRLDEATIKETLERCDEVFNELQLLQRMVQREKIRNK